MALYTCACICKTSSLTKYATNTWGKTITSLTQYSLNSHPHGLVVQLKQAVSTRISRSNDIRLLVTKILLVFTKLEQNEPI